MRLIHTIRVEIPYLPSAHASDGMVAAGINIATIAALVIALAIFLNILNHFPSSVVIVTVGVLIHVSVYNRERVLTGRTCNQPKSPLQCMVA